MVFEDVKVSDLVVFFFKEWVLDFLFKWYVLKDLMIDEKEVLKNYEDFFK